MTSPSDCPPQVRTGILGSKGPCPPAEGHAHPVGSLDTANPSPCVAAGPRRFERDGVTQVPTQEGWIRWVVFQRTARGAFRLTQYLFAPDKDTASRTAAAWYAGCAGTLDVLSYLEYETMLDDLSALARTRVTPAEPGQRRPHMKRGVSYGACVWCGVVTSAPGGRAPLYCVSHRDRKYQRAYRTGMPVVGTTRQAVGA